MSYLLSHKTVITRKPHVCFGCARRFPSGSEMDRDGVVGDGRAWTCYLCPTCREISAGLEYGYEYGYGDLRDEALEIERKREE